MARDSDRPERRPLHRHAERPHELRLQGRTRETRVQSDPSAEVLVRVHPSEQELTVGDRRLPSAPSVAGRTRLRPGALRPDLELASGIDVGDRAAAGADGVDVRHRHHGMVVADAGVEHVLDPQLSPGSDPDVRGGAADVEADHVRLAGQPAGPHPADEPRDRTRHEQGDGPPRHTGDRRAPAVRLHEMQSATEPAGVQGVLQPLHVAHRPGPDVGVERGGREALELPVLRHHLVARADEDPGTLLGHDLDRPPLVRGIEVGEQKADGDGPDAPVAQLARRPPDRLLVQRLQHLAVRTADAFRHRQAMAPRHQRMLLPRQVELQAEVGRALAAGDVEDVAEPFCGDQPAERPLVLHHDVGGDGGPVHEVVDGVERDTGRVRQLAQARHRGPRRVGRDGGYLVDVDASGGLVDQHEVGMGPADIDSDAFHARLGRRSGSGQGHDPAYVSYRENAHTRSRVPGCAGFQPA